MLLFALVKRTYDNLLKSEMAIKNTPCRASKVLKIMDSIPSLRRNALSSGINKARGSEQTESLLDVNEDEDDRTRAFITERTS